MSLKYVREELLKNAAEYFGRTVKFDERCYQSLEHSSQYSADDDFKDIIQAAHVAYSPGIYQALIASGASSESIEETIGDYMRTRIAIPVTPDLFKAMEEFIGMDAIPLHTSATISTERLFTATLEHAEQTRRIGERQPKAKEANTPLDSEWILCELLYHTSGNFPTFSDVRRFMSTVIQNLEIIRAVDVSAGEQQFVLFHDGKRFRVRPLGALNAFTLDRSPARDGSIWIARGNIVQPCTRFSEEAFDRLEWLINNDRAEREYQQFFEDYPEFLLSLGGGKYVNLHPQVILRSDTSELIPDFLMERINDHLCDICDLKKATEQLTKLKKNRNGFREAIHDAVSQLESYRNWFEDRANRDTCRDKYGFSAYRPQVMVIIGRRLDYYKDIERIQVEGTLPSHVEILTYDDVKERVHNYNKLVSS